MYRLSKFLFLFLLIPLVACTDQPIRLDHPEITPSAKAVFVPRITKTVEVPVPQPVLLPTLSVGITPIQPESEIVDHVDLGELITLCSPLEGLALSELPEVISAPYDPPPPGREERHHGVDFSFYRRGERVSIEGIGVQSVFSGTVSATLHDRYPYGNMVIVETKYTELPGGIKTALDLDPSESLYLLYAHMVEKPAIQLAEQVQACQSLGKVGKSGNAGVPHLHLEARIGPVGAQFSSMAYYLVQSTQEERDNYEFWRTSGVFRHFDPMVIITEFN